MSRVLYIDAASGASGDMLLGALVDLGLALEALSAELRKLPLDGYRLEARRVLRSGLSAVKVDVLVDASPAHGHPHRGLREIQDLLERSTLEPAVKARAAALFARLAEAEARVHGTTPEQVHFHEVGALDSIVDVVGGVIGLRWLGAARTVCSPLNLGSGTVTMSHGTFPVPPPATALLVQGAPVYGAGDGELLTPTGALLLTGHADEYGPLPALRLERVGYGAGSRETPGRPNALRLLVGDDGAGAAERLLVLEAQVDDMPAQLLGSLMERLLEAQAADVFYTPVHMKKGRPGILITVLCEPEQREALEELLFSESTTLGVRRHEVARTALDRELRQVATAYGPVGVKLGRRAGRVSNAQPEFEDCRRAAAAAGVPVKEVWAAALAAFREGERQP